MTAEGIEFTNFDRVVVSVEPAALGEINSPSDLTGVRYSAEFGLDQQTRIRRAVIRNDNQPSHLANLDSETKLAMQHLNFMLESLKSGDTATSRRHAEHAHNIIVGEQDARFGDLDGNGRVENPSATGTGILVFHGSLAAELRDIAENPLLLSPRSQFYASEVVPLTMANQRAQLEQVLTLNERAAEQNDIDQAIPLAEQSIAELVAVLAGKDLDENGVIDAKQGESGILGFQNLLHLLTDRTFRVEPD